MEPHEIFTRQAFSGIGLYVPG